MKPDYIHTVPRRARRKAPLNVGGRERLLSATLGAGLVALGAQRRGALGFFSAALGGMLALRGVRGHCPAYAAFGLSTRRTPGVSPGSAARLAAVTEAPRLSRLERTVTVARSPDDVYRFLQDIDRIPEYSPHITNIELLGDGRVQVWTREAGAGPWDAQVELDAEARQIVLRHVGDPDETLSVLLAEAPGQRGTEIKVMLDLGRERSMLRRALAAIAGNDPDRLLREDLRRLKMLLEAGEIVTSQGAPSGRRAPVLRAA